MVLLEDKDVWNKLFHEVSECKWCSFAYDLKRDHHIHPTCTRNISIWGKFGRGLKECKGVCVNFERKKI